EVKRDAVLVQVAGQAFLLARLGVQHPPRAPGRRQVALVEQPLGEQRGFGRKDRHRRVPPTESLMVVRGDPSRPGQRPVARRGPGARGGRPRACPEPPAFGAIGRSARSRPAAVPPRDRRLPLAVNRCFHGNATMDEPGAIILGKVYLTSRRKLKKKPKLRPKTFPDRYLLPAPRIFRALDTGGPPAGPGSGRPAAEGPRGRPHKAPPGSLGRTRPGSPRSNPLTPTLRPRSGPTGGPTGPPPAAPRAAP